MLDDSPVIPAIIEKRKALSPQHALLVGISGIDASGKGFVTTRIAESLQKRGIKLAVISADGWLNLPHVRFHQQDLAKHFYEKSKTRLSKSFQFHHRMGYKPRFPIPKTPSASHRPAQRNAFCRR